MARQNAPLFSFNQGEVSRLALARVDVAKLRLAAACQLNLSPWTLGPMMLRPGTIKVGETLSDLKSRSIRFVFSKYDVALIELTTTTMRVRVNEQLVTRATVATAISDPTFQTGTGWVTTGTTDGATATANTGSAILKNVPAGGLARIQQTITIAAPDQATEHGLRIAVDNGPVTVRLGSAAGDDNLIDQTVLDTGTHSLAFTPLTGSVVLQIDSSDAWQKKVSSVLIDGAGALTLPTPYAEGDLQNIRYDQSGDVIFLACYGQPQYKIERRSTTSWSVVLYRSSDGPFMPAPGIDANFTCNAFTGNGTMVSDRPFFTTGHIGALFRLFTSGQVYQTILGATNAFTPAVRVSGVGTVARNFNWAAGGTYVGSLTWQRSYDGPDSGFVDVLTQSSGATGTLFTSSTGGTAGTPDLDNIVCWERVGFKAGNYISGSVTVNSGFFGDGGFGIVRVTDFVNPEQVKVEVLQALSNTVATKDWQEQDWSADAGFPSSVAFFDGRLFWFGRDKFWGSRSNNYVSYADTDGNGNALGDSGALNEQFGAGPVDTVSWGLALTRLLAGREGSVASIRASAFDEVLTPTNISSKDCTTHGAARMPALRVDTTGVYVEQCNRRVYKLVFNTQALDYVAIDLTRLNLDIGKPGFVMDDVQRQPDTNMHFVRADGQLATLLDDVQDDVTCWTRMQTAGVIEDVCVLPDAGLEDLVYLTVRRTINGTTRRFHERIAHRDSAIGDSLNVMADCCLSYSGSPVGTVQLSWLPNTAVIVWADGADRGTFTTDGSGNITFPNGATYSDIVAGLGGAIIVGSTTPTLSNEKTPDQVFTAASATLTVPTIYEGCPVEVFADPTGNGKMKHIGALVVSGGKVTLPGRRTAATIVACCGYIGAFMSAKLAYAAQAGSALTQKKKLDHVGLVLQDAHYQGIRYGQDFALLDELPLVESGATTPADTVWLELDEPMVELNGDWDTDSRLCLAAAAPRPVTIAGVVISVETNEKV